MTPVQVRAAHRAQLALLKQGREKARDQQQNLASAEAWWPNGFCTECSLHSCIWKYPVPPWCYCPSWCLRKILSSSWSDQDPAPYQGLGLLMFFTSCLHGNFLWLPDHRSYRCPWHFIGGCSERRRVHISHGRSWDDCSPERFLSTCNRQSRWLHFWLWLGSHGLRLRLINP